MEKLTIEHLSAYLPYGLKVHYPKANRGWVLDKDTFSFTVDIIEDIKPVLRSMKNFASTDIYRKLNDGYYDLEFNRDGKVVIQIDHHWRTIESFPYDAIKLLLKEHYDIFGLIDKGLAINYNELNPDK